MSFHSYHLRYNDLEFHSILMSEVAFSSLLDVMRFSYHPVLLHNQAAQPQSSCINFLNNL